MSASFFDNIKRRLAGEEHPAHRARRLIEQAYRDRARLDLIENNGQESGSVMAAAIEHIAEGANSFVINQPSVGAATIQLPTHLELRVTFRLDKERYTFQTQSLGRAKIRSGGNRMIYGYKLAMPDEVNHSVQQRSVFRIRVGIDLAPGANVELDGGEPLHLNGIVDDLSVGGMLITTNQSLKGANVGQSGTARFSLPEPVGDVEVSIQIRHLDRGSRLNAIGLEFQNKIEGLAEMIRTHELKRAKRAG